MNKKILSVVLILCVMLAVMPMTAYAAVRAFCPKCDQAQTVRMTCQYANDKWHRCDLTCTVCDNTWNYWQAHTWSGTATCTSGKTCTVCGGSSEPLGHDWSTWTQNSDEKTHTRICKRDASHTETNNCTGGTADLHRQGCLHGLRRRIRRDGGTQLHCRKSRGAVFEVCCNLYRKGGLLQVLRSLRSELRRHGG